MATIERTETLVDLTEAAAAKIKAMMAQEPAGEATCSGSPFRAAAARGFEYALGFDRGAGGRPSSSSTA